MTSILSTMESDRLDETLADPRRPRLLVTAARRAARHLRPAPLSLSENGTGGCDAAKVAHCPASLATLRAAEAAMEATRRYRPHAWRAAAHVTALATLLARQGVEGAQAKASGSEALRSAT